MGVSRSLRVTVVLRRERSKMATPRKKSLAGREDPTKTKAYKQGYRAGLKVGKSGKRGLGPESTIGRSGYKAGKRTAVASRRAAGGDGANWRKKK